MPETGLNPKGKIMTRRFRSAQEALSVQENDLKCAKRAREWGMTESAKRWQQNADAAFDAFLEITEEECKARRRNG